MATVLTAKIENNNARIEQVARQVNDLAKTMNPAFGAGPHHRNPVYNYNNPPVMIGRGEDLNRGQGAEANAAQAYGNNITQAVEQILNIAGFNLGESGE
ncbi:hypothetical protein PIB30_042272 [Stylosanthes scabra]|uniref:Uncharacterized protein n=1 Tax=Stylosanthes scabra TaxID=79078 RepID=A0ABU6TEU5_9FABA|nr:hypothetical protein [Stylosanthes scabra]